MTTKDEPRCIDCGRTGAEFQADCKVAHPTSHEWGDDRCGGCNRAPDEIAAQGRCHTCSFWASQLVETSDRVVVNGRHYWVGPRSTGPKHCKGHGGHEFHITFHDGRKVVTDNLWCQGAIPECFRDRLPDNATFDHLAVG